MKTFLSILAVVSVFGIAAPSDASPPFMHQRRIVSYAGNGMPVYAVYQIVGYNSMGYPIYQWVTQPVGPSYGYGYRSYNNYRPIYGRPSFGGHFGHHHGGPVFHGGGHSSHGHGGHHGHH